MAPHDQKELAELVVKSIQALEEMKGDHHLFVKVDRVRHRRTMEPTNLQQDLLGWIERRGFVRWELTLGMHWGILGGLMARGLVQETKQNGVRGIVARSR